MHSVGETGDETNRLGGRIDGVFASTRKLVAYLTNMPRHHRGRLSSPGLDLLQPLLPPRVASALPFQEIEIELCHLMISFLSLFPFDASDENGIHSRRRNRDRVGMVE